MDVTSSSPFIKPGDDIALDCDCYGPAEMAGLFDTVVNKWYITDN